MVEGFKSENGRRQNPTRKRIINNMGCKTKPKGKKK